MIALMMGMLLMAASTGLLRQLMGKAGCFESYQQMAEPLP